jgi:signal peptidase II
VLIDQVTKQLALQYLPYQVDVALLPFFSLYLTHNKGVAFGMFPSLFWVWTALITVFVIYAHFIVPKSTEHAKIPLMLLVGGALGNLIDRYTISAGVVDFFHLWNFAVFNIADIAVTLGVVWLLILQLKGITLQKKESPVKQN